MGQREDALAVAIPQIGKMFGNVGMGLAGDNPGLRQMAGSVVGTGDEMSRNIENAIAQREAEAEAKKKQRGATWGKIGSLAGALLAIPTGGASLLASSAAGAAGSAIGGAAGQALGGGSVDAGDLIGYGLSGGIGGGMSQWLGGPTGVLTDTPAATAWSPFNANLLGVLGGAQLGNGLMPKRGSFEDILYYGG